MKTIGLIGGTGWVSTLEYYRLINVMIGQELGGLNAAQCVLYSFNYADINALNRIGDVSGVYRLVLQAAERLECAGVDCLLLCANTLHQFADDLERNIRVPLVHIADAVSLEVKRRQFSQVGLLGTRMTMEWDFYRQRLQRNGIDVLLPAKDDRDFIDDTIFTQLLKHIVSGQSKKRFMQIIDGLRNNGAQAVILGCTEIPLLIQPEDTAVPLIDTLQVHSRAAVAFALNRNC